MESVCLGLLFELEIGFYFEEIYAWHNRPGPINKRPGFRMMDWILHADTHTNILDGKLLLRASISAVNILIKSFFGKLILKISR